MTASPAALDLLRRLLRSALAAEEGAAPTAVPLGDVPTRDLLDVVRRHRVPEVLRTHAEGLGLPDDLVAVLDGWRRQYRPRLQLQTLESVRVAKLLGASGIDALLFKGQALAVQTTGLADARGPGDVDVLVAPDAVAEAHRVLTAAGWSLRERGRVEPGTWAWRHVVRWGNALTYAGNGADVDLHWRFEALPGAHPEIGELWPRRDEVRLGDARVATLARADALRHLAGHREGWIWMRTLVDLRRLVRDPAVLAGELRPEAAASLAVAREAVGLPLHLPDRVHARLDRVPSSVLERARGYHGVEVPSTFAGGAGSALRLRNHVASSRTVADLEHAAMALLLPAHAALPVRARSAWTGVPLALGLRMGSLLRGLLARIRRGGPCAERPGHAA